MTITYAIGRDGRRRILADGDFLRDGERIVVPFLAMDATPPQGPQEVAHAAYEASVRALDYRSRQSPDGPQVSPEVAYQRMCAELDYRNRSQA